MTNLILMEHAIGLFLFAGALLGFLLLLISRQSFKNISNDEIASSFMLGMSVIVAILFISSLANEEVKLAVLKSPSMLFVCGLLTLLFAIQELYGLAIKRTKFRVDLHINSTTKKNSKVSP